MEIVSKVRTGFGINLREQNVWPRDAESLRKLVACCSKHFKETFWDHFPENDVFAENWEVVEILENMNPDSSLMALATIMQDAILHEHHILLTAAIDFADSDDVILAVPDDDPAREQPAYSKVDVRTLLVQYCQLIGCASCDPSYISWHVEVKHIRHFVVDTPVGKLSIRAKSDDVNDTDYPGVYIDFLGNNGKQVPLACVEFAPDADTIATDVYRDEDVAERYFHKNLPGANLAIAKNYISAFLKKEYLEDVDEDFHDLSHIALAWGAVDEQEQVEVNVYADLEAFSMKTYLTAAGQTAVLVSTNNYPSLEELTFNELDMLDYDSLVSIMHEEWVEFSKDSGTQKWLQDQFPIGTTRHFEGFNADYDGTIKGLTDSGRILVEAVDGTTVSLLYCGDLFTEVE